MVELNSTIYYNPNAIDSASTVRTLVSDTLSTYSKSDDLNKFGGKFKYSKFKRLLTRRTFITSNITKVKFVETLSQTPVILHNMNFVWKCVP